LWGFTGLLFFIAVHFILITYRDFFKVCVDFCRAVSTVLDTLRKENFYENVCIFPSYNRFCEIVRVFGAQQNAPAAGKFRPQGRCGAWFNSLWLYTVVECWVNLAMVALTSGIFSGNRRHFMP
jgi:hypothetical protein